MKQTLAIGLACGILGLISWRCARAESTDPKEPEAIESAVQGPSLYEIRSQATRKEKLVAHGGSAGSEAGVGHSLKWIAEHQAVDGGWSFDHGVNNKHVGPVNNPGSDKSTGGATAIALLPFLTAGQTHKEGKYKDTVQRGLDYLRRVQEEKTGDLRGGGDFYAQAFGAMALCEAYAQTQDQALAEPAQKAIHFVVEAQSKDSGGWRTSPAQPCDLSVTGWHVMALKSARLAQLKVPPPAMTGASSYLNRLQKVGDATRYGLTEPGEDPTMSALGLRCRIDLGWRADNPALKQGVEFLAQTKPSKDLHFNFHATQVMFHVGGEPWKRWNSVMREMLIAGQIQAGTYTAEKGSWWTGRPAHGIDGGRLYETALSSMMLEVYYRYVPLDSKATR